LKSKTIGETVVKKTPRLLSTALSVIAIFGAIGTGAISFVPPAEIEALQKKIRAVETLIRAPGETVPAPSAKTTDTAKSVVGEPRAPAPKGSQAAERRVEEAKPAPSAKTMDTAKSVAEEPKVPPPRSSDAAQPKLVEARPAQSLGNSDTAKPTVSEEAKPPAPGHEAMSKRASPAERSKGQSSSREAAIESPATGSSPSPNSSSVPPPPKPVRPGNAGASGAGAGGAAAISGKSQVEGPDAMRKCMNSWDKETHMSMTEWRATCVRTLKSYPAF
jgi:hypothetical protein